MIVKSTRLRSNKIHMNVGEPSSWNRDMVNWSLDLSLNLTPLTTDAGLGPKVDISGQELPCKTPWNKSPGSLFNRMRNFVDGLENCFSHRLWNQKTENTCWNITEKLGTRNGNRDNLWSLGLGEVLNFRTGLLEQWHLRIWYSWNW